jgi:hypothetical protein
VKKKSSKNAVKGGGREGIGWVGMEGREVNCGETVKGT